LQDLRDELLAKDPVFRAAWEASAPRRRLVTALVRLRRKADLTQQELAAKAGWERAFVSRLESLPRDRVSLALPDLATLARYAEACGCELALVFGQPRARAGELEVTAAVSLSDDERFTSTLATWSGRRIGIHRRPAKRRDNSRAD
jgi:transcriptional regulator with XRE-family HTH domain